MNKNLQSPTKLTEFAPLQPEEKKEGVGQFISKFFKLTKSAPASEPIVENVVDNSSQDALPAWANDANLDGTTSSITKDKVSSSTNSNLNSNANASSKVYDVNPADGRNHINVLKRISNLLALKSNNLQAYADTELKQYWMPDSVSKECYECSEKFTTFRRRHHCRVCGQIFCSQCCYQQIPGKIFGCTGDLRVCTYCCKVVLTYLQSSDLDFDLTEDLRSLEKNLQSKYGSNASLTLGGQPQPSSNDSSNEPKSNTSTLRRKISLAYQEEKFASSRGTQNVISYLSNEEKIRAFQNSTSLRNLYEEIFHPTTGICLQSHRYRLRNYSNCLLGSELVDWLIFQQKANTRVQAATICQALLEGGYIESVTDGCEFLDGFSIYKPGVIVSPEPIQSSKTLEASHQDEPSWVQYVPQENSTTDSDTEFSPNQARITSSSSYSLDLNVGANTVYLSRPLTSTQSVYSFDSEPDLETKSSINQQNTKIECPETPRVMTTEQTEVAPESGWHNAMKLREENGEARCYELLTQAFKQHEESLLKQLLSVNGLSLSWCEVLMPLIHEVVDVIRPDMNHDAHDIDIRKHVHIKKVLGHTKSDSELVRGIVFSKNIAHKGMSIKFENPKILLLQCPIVYQRQEGRLMSLEPVLMQEHEYLRHAAARIAALQPNIVLVQKTVSRLAQDLLREKNVTLVYNVKEQILERLARCTQADLVSSIDAHIGPRPRLGSCKKFYLKTFSTENGISKTLMFFEGLPMPNLGGTLLLKGPSRREMIKVKKVASLYLFACYNWRLEKSFLMDIFAQPPNSKHEFFDESKDNSPTEPEKEPPTNDLNKNNEDQQQTTNLDSELSLQTNPNTNEGMKKQPKKQINKAKEIIDDFTDPLHSNDNEIFAKRGSQKLSVAELPFSNNFRKALDDTILCISPYLVFSVPFLETELGRKCKLRKFFPEDIYYSSQFNTSKLNQTIKNRIEINETINKQDILNLNNRKINEPHPFVTAEISSSIDSVEVQTLLASFRACGGRYPKKKTLILPFTKELNEKNEQEENEYNELEKNDVLDPNNHQRISVLFCSFTNESDPFCVNPWVVQMDFYRINDIPLGCFLERYCFTTSYGCQLKTCEVSMLKHIRRFVHNSGCVSLSLSSCKELTEDGIVMWSWCAKCESVSPLVPMSTDTWSFSFAKYLELLFHGNIYTRRGNPPCSHSLHHDNYQCFGYKNILACFKYTPIDIWEITLPPPIIEINYDVPAQQNEIINEIKALALKGHEIYSLIKEKLADFPADLDLKQLVVKEQANFKQKIEEVQLKLTSPTLENKDINYSTEETDSEHQAAIWKIQDSLVRIKIVIFEAVEVWNTRLPDAFKKRELEKKNSKSSELDSPTSPEMKPLLDAQAVVDSSTSSTSSDLTNSNAITKKIKSLDGEEERPPSPKAHHRSHSEGTVLSQTQNEGGQGGGGGDLHDGKKESDKKSVKTILSQLLPSNTTFTPLLPPFSPQEHYMLQTGKYMPLVVYENEPSSIIAYTLNSLHYKIAFDEITGKKLHSNEPTPSPVHKRKMTSDKSGGGGENNETSQQVEKSSLLSFLRAKESKSDNIMTSSTNSADFLNSTNNTNNDKEANVVNEKIEEGKSKSKQHINIQFEDAGCNFFCRVYCAEKFANLRSTVLPIGEEAYIRSISRCVQWNARGGKSGSAFCKTVDDRFILKEMSSSEVKIFLDSASNYFAYMHNCYANSQPTLLGKIVGVYQVIFRNTTTNQALRTNLLIMENLFYNRSVEQKFDLKGSMRNRLVNPDNQDGEIVLLDENLMKMTCDNPLYILPHSKAVLTSAIQNDTKFLSKQAVMDYSLLVGLDKKNKELVLGIIDYIRTFTWDKKIETIVKKNLVIGAQGKLPTIISPEEYQKRFIEAMHRYFLEVPDPWAGLGKSIEC